MNIFQHCETIYVHGQDFFTLFLKLRVFQIDTGTS